ncbi:MAG: hypothetical protein AB1505_11130 [Candidatus Latescibacterota bacterium]
MSIRWYTAQLQGLPPRSRQELTQELLRHLRRGATPTKREWRDLISRSLEPYLVEPKVKPRKPAYPPRKPPEWIAEMILATSRGSP